jgi:hypothetical protein
MERAHEIRSRPDNESTKPCGRRILENGPWSRTSRILIVSSSLRGVNTGSDMFSRPITGPHFPIIALSSRPSTSTSLTFPVPLTPQIPVPSSSMTHAERLYRSEADLTSMFDVRRENKDGSTSWAPPIASRTNIKLDPLPIAISRCGSSRLSDTRQTLELNRARPEFVVRQSESMHAFVSRLYLNHCECGLRCLRIDTTF